MPFEVQIANDDTNRVSVQIPAYKINQSIPSGCSIKTEYEYQDPEDNYQWKSTESESIWVAQPVGERFATWEVNQSYYITDLATKFGGWDGENEEDLPESVIINTRFVTQDVTNADPAKIIYDMFEVRVISNGKTSQDFCDYSMITKESGQDYTINYFIQESSQYDYSPTSTTDYYTSRSEQEMTLYFSGLGEVEGECGNYIYYTLETKDRDGSWIRLFNMNDWRDQMNETDATTTQMPWEGMVPVYLKKENIYTSTGE
jgi:hypothetical protein